MTDFVDSVLYAVVFVLSILGTKGTPTFSLGLPSFSAFGGRQQNDISIKPYSGIRIKNDSLRMIYYNEQTVAIVELGPKKLLLNCELIEAYEPRSAMQLLGDLTKVSPALAISFSEMITLMTQCQMLEEPPQVQQRLSQPASTAVLDMSGQSRGLLSNNPFTLFSGIIPGTKWCGTGDIADNYHDLGQEASVDKCCRMHDLCPVKIRAYDNRYNLTNNSLYSKSHCQCDYNLYNCLKQSNSPTGSLLGNVYFNLVRVPCIEDTSRGKKQFSLPKTDF